MTMLSRMRRHLGVLKWILAIVCLAFVVFYIPDFLQSNAGASGRDTVASVDGQTITATEFQRSYEAQLDSYRAAYGGKISDQMLRQLGIDQQILQQMVDERAAVSEAAHLGLSVSDAEVRDAIFSMPAFQENGRFIGEARYVALLRAQRPPMTPSDFESSVRDSLLVQKLRDTLTGWITVSDAEAQRAYHVQNDKVKLDLVTIPADTFIPQVQVTDADIAAYFDAHKEHYRIGEKRRVKYLLVDVGALRKQVTVSAADIEKYYNDNIQMYSTPEQIRVRHILFKTTGKDDAQVKAEAEKVLAMAKAGADFADLAKKYSQDEATAKLGGDLDYFSRGKMVPAFDQAAFALKPGEISGLVKTQYGYHIIKMEDRKPATTKPLAEVQGAISDQIAMQRAQAQGADEIEKLAGEIHTPGDLAKVARQAGLTVQESDYFLPGEPILGLGPSPDASQTAFALKPGEVSGPVQVSSGYAILALDGSQPPYIPKLDEVKSRVKQDVIQEKATALARDQAQALEAKLKAKPEDFDAIVKAAKLTPQSTALMTRNTPLPGVGASPALTAAAFSLPVGDVSAPITTPTGVVICRVTERQIATPEEYAKARDGFIAQLLSQRRAQFFSAYMDKAKARMKILVNRETLQRVVGS
ncbi:MAG: peptidyl-prolyl cis-trans isomerase [Acidobacteriota bacterium]|nr:peptidyl-prolyl cis-trans isomerase [Acidobacteriota bacterium]